MSETAWIRKDTEVIIRNTKEREYLVMIVEPFTQGE